MAEKFDDFENEPTMNNPIDRRTMLSTGAAMVGGLIAGQMLPGVAKAAAAKPAAPPANTFTVGIFGEAMVTRSFSMLTDPNFLGIRKLLQESDLAYGHMEMNIAADEEMKWTPRGPVGQAGYLYASPQIAKDLRWLGADVMSLAQNHSLDWGPEGLLGTIRHCGENGIACAGTGINLEAARAPGFFEVEKGRMALVSIASGNNAYEWAGLPKGKHPGRPGVNPMRMRTINRVPKATADQLKAVAKSLGTLNARAAEAKEFTVAGGAAGVGATGFTGAVFQESDHFEITSEAYAPDVRGNLRSVDEAQKMADFVLVAQHNSTSEAGRGTKPSAFIVDFARKAIDAGADMYLGHGWHTFLGIEIYKGKPIFYGLGSFFWESQWITDVPADEFESYNVDMDNLTAVNAAAGNLHPEGSDDWGWSAVFQVKYVDKKLTEIVLHPIEMGYDFTGEKPVRNRVIGRGEMKYLDGSPRLATGANGQKILEKLAKVCQERGTRLDIKDGVGTIKV
jgi:poly-gamma-glutamate synthesis protein (capsule biosynthesis protein)